MNKLKGYLGSLGMSNSSAGSQAPAAGKLDELGCEDALDAAQFSYFKASIFGFPAEPSCFAYDPVQRLFAIGTKTGRVRVFGQPGAECYLQHPAYNDPSSSSIDVSSQQLETKTASPQAAVPAPIIQILFVINEGGLITMCSDYKLHYWDIRSKQPSIRHSIQFQREIPSYCFHPVQSKWLFVGTTQGNVHFVNLESFTLSGYIIYWNKAVGPAMCSKHPGAVVQLVDSPVDPNKLLIGFESGLVVLWDLKSKNTECKFAVQEGLHYLSWHSDGRYFMSSHTDGSLITWDIKTPAKPASVEQPHAMSKPSGKEYFMPIPKVEWKTAPESQGAIMDKVWKYSEQFVLFSGGTAISRDRRSPSTLSIMRGKNLNLLDLQSEIIDFCTLCSSPFAYEVQNPIAVAVLLENDMIIFDLQTPGYPPYENPYSMDIHDSEVSYNGFIVDVSPDIVPALYKAGMRQRQNAFSPKEWPIKGGAPSQSLGSYSQLIITGHRNGIVKFWDASGIQLQILYLLNVSKLFQTSSESKRKLHAAVSNARAVPQQQSDAAESPVREGSEQCGENFVEVTKEDSSAAVSVQPQNSVDQPAGLSSLVNAGIFTITRVKLSDNGQLLLVGGVGFAVLYRLNESQAETSLAVVEARFPYSSNMQSTPVTATTPLSTNANQQAAQDGFSAQGGEGSSGGSSCQLNLSVRQSTTSLGSQSAGPQGCFLKQGPRRWNAGYQPDLAVILGWLFSAPSSGEVPNQPPAVTSLDLQQTNQVIFVGTSCGVVVVDCVQKACVMKLTTPELYACIDPATLRTVLKKALKDQRAAAEASDEEAENPPAIVKPSCSNQELEKELAAFALPEVPKPATKSNAKRHMSLAPGLLGHQVISEKKESLMVDLVPRHSSLAPTVLDPTNEGVAEEGSGDEEAEEQVVPLQKALPARRKMSVFQRISTAIRPNSSPPSRRFSAVVPSFSTELALQPQDETAYQRKLAQADVNFIDLRESFTESASTGGGRDSPDIFEKTAASEKTAPADTITTALFADSYPNKIKADPKLVVPPPTVPTLWIGTQAGAVFIAAISLPPNDDERATSPVIVSVSQTVYQLNGPVLTVAVLPMSEFLSSKQQHHGPMLSPPEVAPKLKAKQSAPSGGLPVFPGNSLPDSTTTMAQNAACQLAVLVSRDQLVTIVLPVQSVASRAKPSSPAEGDARRQLTRAAIVRPREHHPGYCVACLSSDGQVSIFSLPRLRPLFEVDQCCDPVTPRSLSTFRFSHYGHAVYFDSPSEINKLSFWAETNERMDCSQGCVFVEQPMPERPKQSFLKTLFNSAPAATAIAEREELFGDPSLKPSVNVAKPVNKMQQLHAELSSATSSTNSPYGRMIEGAKERGEKLGELDEKTQRMMLGAADFAKNAAAMVEREKNKKWYNPFS